MVRTKLSKDESDVLKIMKTMMARETDVNNPSSSSPSRLWTSTRKEK
jgi:hypothetical protein